MTWLSSDGFRRFLRGVAWSRQSLASVSGLYRVVPVGSRRAWVDECRRRRCSDVPNDGAIPIFMAVVNGGHPWRVYVGKFESGTTRY